MRMAVGPTVSAPVASSLIGACLFGCPCGSPSADTTPAISRRAALASAVGLAAALPVSPALADDDVDDAWTLHEGPFEESYFADFTVSKAEASFKYKFLREGDGGPKPVPFQKVKVNYRGYLLDGTLVDSSYGRGKPFSFRLGKGKVILGWEGIIPGMTIGQRVCVRVPPQYAYGDEKKGKIPANSPLVFFMELVELGDIQKADGFMEEISKG